jgi:aryl-alcohol dehydrogenase-like predicted oxidoreductase
MMFPENINLGGRPVSRLGFGCWQLGGHGWGGLDAKALEDAVKTALDSGVNFFDTADVYGLGHSEEALGRLLQNSDAYVATKFGVRFTDGKRHIDNSDEWINTAVDASRKRLNRDCIDLYQLHWHDEKTDLRIVFDTLENLRAKKMIRHYGICNTALDWQKKDIPEGLVSFSFEYSLIRRGHEKIIRHMQDNLGLTFLSWGSLSQGLLTGRYSRDHKFPEDDIRSRAGSLFAPENWDQYDPILARLRAASAQLNQPMGRVALRWILDSMGGIALAGIKNTEQLTDNIQAFGWKLPQDIIETLNEASHG